VPFQTLNADLPSFSAACKGEPWYQSLVFQQTVQSPHFPNSESHDLSANARNHLLSTEEKDLFKQFIHHAVVFTSLDHKETKQKRPPKYSRRVPH
jgi:hypothetical protein